MGVENGRYVCMSHRERRRNFISGNRADSLGENGGEDNSIRKEWEKKTE